MMSGQKDVNPFGNPEDVNPFADPYVALSANDKNNAPPANNVPVFNALPPYMEKPPEYNQSTAPPSIQATMQPVQQPSYYQPKPFAAETQPANLQSIQPVFPGQSSQPTYSSQQTLNQAELERKANELEQREQELNRLQRAGIKTNNFPPLPSFCPWKPCYYHDISVEIPTSAQKTCKIMFYIWQFYVLSLVANFISCLALLVGGTSSSDSAGSTFGVALVFMVLFAPCSFVFWYRPIYKALRNDSSFNYMLFFFVFFCQIVFCGLCALGIPGFGTAGWINAIGQLTRGSTGVGALMIITAIMWSILCAAMIFYLKMLHHAYRTSGASLEKAQGEFAVGIASNKAVQNVAIESMRAGIAQGGQGQGQARN